MQLAKLSKVVSEEQEAEKFLRERGILKEFGAVRIAGASSFGGCEGIFTSAASASENGVFAKGACWRG